MLAAAASESLAESVVDGQNIKTTRLLSHAPEEKKRGVGREGDAPHSEQNRPPEDFAQLVTQAQVMHDANLLFISHEDQPADAPAAGCDTIGKQTIFDLDEEEEPEEEEEEEFFRRWCSHQAQTHNGQVLGLAHRLGQSAQELNLCLLAPLCAEERNSELP